MFLQDNLNLATRFAFDVSLACSLTSYDAGIRTRGSMHTPRHYESKSLRTLVRTRSLRSIESGTVNAAGHGGLFDVVTRLGGRVTEEKLQNVQYASDIQLQVGVGY